MPKRHKIQSIFLRTAYCVLSTLPFSAYAQKLAVPSPTWGTMDDYIVTLINIVQTLGLGVALAWFIFTAFTLVAARGDDTALPDAKKRLLIALCILVVLLALKLTWTLIGGTYAALGFIATIFLILFLFWALK